MARRFATRAIWEGQDPPETGDVMPPIHVSTTFAQPGPGEGDYEYGRTGNPTRDQLQAVLASLEGGDHGLCFSSGMAAEQAVTELLSPGDRVVAGEDCYGGTYRLFQQVLAKRDLEFVWVDTQDPDDLDAALAPGADLLWLESPTNPLLRVTDLGAAAEMGRDAGAWVAVDNTFMSPYRQRPLDLGADIVVHSTTKFLNGHSDVVGGCLVLDDDGMADDLAFLQNAIGAVPSPIDCWLTLRGVKTLQARMEAHEANARAVADLLVDHPTVRQVHWPGLADHRNHDVHTKQADGFGPLMSFELADLDAVRSFVDQLDWIPLAESLGGVETLLNHPARMTHASLPADRRDELGITDGLLRISVGIEDIRDILDELTRGLDAA